MNENSPTIAATPLIGALVDYGTSNNPKVQRILWIDRSEDICWLIDVNNPRALPTKTLLSHLQDRLREGTVRNLEHDCWGHLRNSELQIPESHISRREAAWKLIEPLFREPGPQAYDAQFRGKMLAEISAEHQVAKRHLYRLVRRYFQRGQIRNALLPDFSKCGGAGKRRNGTKKRGAKGHISQGGGINVTNEIVAIFRQAIKLFYNTSLRFPITHAYQHMWEHFFNDGYELKNGVMTPHLMPADKVPTERQFRYWLKILLDIKESNTKRHSVHEWNANIRPKGGSTKGLAHGPGWCFQLDATLADIILVSSFNRKQHIGRPTLYSVIDVFSRLIVGFWVGLKHPSYSAASLAILHAASPKAPFCAKYGIEGFVPALWPSEHLGHYLVGDRGEMAGGKADTLVNSLGFALSNTASYRADWKSIVERSFRTYNDILIRWLPGSTANETKHRSSRLDALLTLDDFRTLMTYCVLHNNSRRMTDYPLDADMIAADVEPIPSELWQWGVEHRSGCLRTMPQEILRQNLLPSEGASLTSEGIKFEQLHYNCAEIEPLVTAAAVGDAKTIRISVDPDDVSAVYYRVKRDSPMIRVPLRREDRETYGGRTLEDVKALRRKHKIGNFDHRTSERQKKADFHAQAERKVNAAKALQNSTVSVETKASHKRNVDGARKKELEADRTAELSQRGVTALPAQSDSKIVQLNGYIAAPQEVDLLDAAFNAKTKAADQPSNS